MPDGGNAGGDPPRVTLETAHAVDGRLRLRVRHDLAPAAWAGLADRLACVPGVRKVVLRPNTRSAILTIDEPAATILARLRETPGTRVADAPTPPPIGQTLQLGLMKLDHDLKRTTHEAADLRGLIAVLLLIAAGGQLLRGKVAGPASTLAMAAFSLLDPGRTK